MDDIEASLKRELARELCAIIDGWPQVDIAYHLKLSQPDISRLRNGKLDDYSASRLLRLILARGYNADLHLHEKWVTFGRAQPSRIAVVRFDRFGRPHVQR